jgi:hypothetical protein
MAEVQTSTESGEMTQRFIEMVMMMAQNAAYALGQIPHPETGEAPVNLELARIFVDQLVLLRTKTRGNLSQEELGVLNNAISNLQMVFFEVSQDGSSAPVSTDSREPEASDAAAPAEEAPAASPEPAAPEASAPPAEESRKKFSKSYGS